MPSICYDDDSREREKTVGGIAVTVSMPHRFPYGSILFFRHARTVIVDLIDRSLLLHRGSTKAHCVLIARGLVVGSRDIKSNDRVRDRNVDQRLFACYLLRRLVALFELLSPYSLANAAHKDAFFSRVYTTD